MNLDYERENPVPRCFQRAALGGHTIARTLVWSLRLGASLELGVWVWCFAARSIPLKTARNRKSGVKNLSTNILMVFDVNSI